MIDVPVAITKSELINNVCELVEHDNLSYIEAIIEVCDRLDIEYEDIVSIVKHTPLKEKIKEEAIRNHNMKAKVRTARLPI